MELILNDVTNHRYNNRVIPLYNNPFEGVFVGLLGPLANPTACWHSNEAHIIIYRGLKVGK